MDDVWAKAAAENLNKDNWLLSDATQEELDNVAAIIATHCSAEMETMKRLYTDASAVVDRLALELSELRSESKLMRPVVEAAIAYTVEFKTGMTSEALQHLAIAVNEYKEGIAAAASPAPKEEEAHRCPHCGRRMQSDFDEDVGFWYECANCDYKEAVSSTVTAAKPSGAAREAADRPRIICLCGSTRFIEQFAIKTWELERQGFIVLGCTLLPVWYCNVPSRFGEATGTKEQCDELHKRKIDLADEILVLNIGGYIGESTANEIEYATRLGKPVQYLEGVTAPTAPVVSDGDPEG